jgi:hypothetical protein
LNREVESKKGFSWVDWLLMALILLATLAVVFYFYMRLQAENDRSVRVVYRVLVSNAEEGFGEQLAHGMTVTSENGTATLGEILEVEILPHREAVAQNNKLVMAEVPNRKDLYILIEGNGEDRSNEGIRIQDIRISAGSFYNLRLGAYFATNAQILSVQTEEQNEEQGN